MSNLACGINTMLPYGALPFVDEVAVGDESSIIIEEFKKSVNHYSYPISQAFADPYQFFKLLKSEWERETEFLSSITEISMNPAYQQIIGMGYVALPFIFLEMKSKPSHWFWALKSITGEDPVLPVQRGRIREMTGAWFNWAKLQGLLFE